MRIDGRKRRRSAAAAAVAACDAEPRMTIFESRALLGAPSLVLGLDSASGASFYFEHTDSVVRVRPDAGALIMQGYSSGQ